MSIRTIKLRSGQAIPVLGQGTWGMAEDPGRREDEIAALRLGLELGLRIIDTAETYAGGGAEELVGQAIADRRDEVFLVTKVSPDNANRADTIAACERSLHRLGTDHIDLYLLDGRGHTPLFETIAAFAELAADGKIRHWGVSNFGMADMAELARIPGGAEVAVNQVPYSLTRRETEFDLLLWCQDRGIPIMAYSPIERGRVLVHPVVIQVASALGVTPAQVALAWVLNAHGVTAIPRAGRPAHLRQNRDALNVLLPDRYLAKLELAFPPPTRALPLEKL
jgi:diketogulonate reductase-like aldo/keto reductase